MSKIGYSFKFHKFQQICESVKDLDNLIKKIPTMPFGIGNTYPTNDNFLIYPKRRQKITDFKGQNF